MSKVTNVLIVGVGGQGTILASRVLSEITINAGFDVKVSEIHGMAQRGGNVVTQVRYGEKVDSPIVSPGEADVILAFELLEAMRYLPYLKEGGKLIVNTQKINPMPVITGAAEYPEGILEMIAERGELIQLDALAIAQECGMPKGVNVVLLGVLSKYLDFSEDVWLYALRAKVPAKFLEGNLKVFAAGRNA